MTELIKADLHLHTKASPDSLLRPEQLIALAIRRGLGCLAVVDHNRAGIDGLLTRRDSPVRLICGEEVETREGEIIGLFLREEIPGGLSAEETIARIHRQGGLAILPHPCDRLRHHVLNPARWDQVLPLIDAVEGFNGRTVFPADNLAAQALAARFGKPVTAGSDAHTPWEVGRSGLMMLDFRTPAEFLVSLRQASLFGKGAPLWVHLITKAVKMGKRNRNHK